MSSGRAAGSLFLVAAMTVGTVGLAQADPIGPDCKTCQGSIYTLTYDPTPENTFTFGGNSYSLFDVTLTIDTSGYSGGGSYLDSVAVKVNSTDQTEAPGGELDSAPGGAGSWTYHAGGLNSDGCDGNGAGFACAQDGQTAPVPNATSYVWTFDILALNGVLDTGAGAATIKARYVDADGAKVGDLVSEDITLQQDAPTTNGGSTIAGVTEVGLPEPANIVLLGAGLAALGGLGGVRKRLRRT